MSNAKSLSLSGEKQQREKNDCSEHLSLAGNSVVILTEKWNF